MGDYLSNLRRCAGGSQNSQQRKQQPEMPPSADGEGVESIHHRVVPVNGINMHVAEKGVGPVVLLIHGFPELWYAWRHQILSLASSGYHAVAPDLRGYGDTDAPPDRNSYTIFHIVGDLVALIESLDQPKVYVVAHDWGAIVAWGLCMFRPDKVRALLNTSVPFSPRNPAARPVELARAFYGEDFYVVRFQEPGAIEEQFAHLGASLVLKKILTYRSPAPLHIPKDWGSTDTHIALPPWLSEEDFSYYVSKFDKNGFTGPLNYYRCLDLNWELNAPWTGAKVDVPVKFIIGDLDLTYHYAGVKEYLHSGGMKKDVPLLQEVVVLKNVGHFLIEEKSDEITKHILEFIRKF